MSFANEELFAPEHRIAVRHPSGWTGPGFLIGDQRDVILWGFTAGIIARLFDFVGWSRPWDADRLVDLYKERRLDTSSPGGSDYSTTEGVTWILV